MAFIPTLDSSRLLRKKFLSPQSLAELAVEANVWRTAQDNRYVTRAEYVAGGSGIAPTIFDAKGDLIVGSAADTPLRLAVGANGRQLMADSNDIAGVKWGERPALYANLLRNPSVETNTTDIVAAGSGSTISRVTTEFYSGVASVRSVADGTVTNQGVQFTSPTQPAGVYSAAAWVKAPAGTAMRLSMNGTVTASSLFTATGDWQRVTASGAATASGAIGVRIDTNAATAVTHYVDAVMLVAGTDVPDYFDGDTAGCYWTGTAHASTSVRAALSATDGVGRQSLPTLTRNLVTNPSFELGTTGWTALAAATVARTTSGAPFGVAYASGNTGATANGGVEMSTRVRVTPGQSYAFSAFVAGGTGQSGFRFAGVFYTEAGAEITTTSTTFTGIGGFERKSVVGVAPSNAATASIRFTRDTAASAGYSIDAAQIETGTRATAYVDGDQKGCYWTGTPHASESVRMVRGEETVTKLDMPTLVTNLVVNPDMLGTTGWSAGGAATNGTAVSQVAGNGGGVSAIQTTATATGDGGIQQPVGNIPAAPGERHAVAAWIYNGAATSKNAILQVQYRNGGVITNDTSSAAQSVPAGTWARVVVPLTNAAAATTTSLVPFAYLQGLASGDVVRVSSVVVVKTTTSVVPEFFSGNTEGCAFVNAQTPLTSPSFRFVESPADYRLLTWLDAGRAQATGSPEGAITAPVGTRYVDTASTVGATEWQKWSGTGNIGWVATGADTGDRLVASSITNMGDATLVARRVGSQVTVTLIQPTAGTATGTVSLTTLPVGFRPTRTGSIVAVPVVTQAGAIVTGAALAVTDAGAVTLTGATNATRHYAQVTYTTANAYPTTLPGTAA